MLSKLHNYDKLVKLNWQYFCDTMPRCSGVSSLFLVSELIIWVTIMDCITKTTFDFDFIPVLYGQV